MLGDNGEDEGGDDDKTNLFPGISTEDGFSRRNIINASWYVIGVLGLAFAGHMIPDDEEAEADADNSENDDEDDDGGDENYGDTNEAQLSGYLNVLEGVVPDASQVGTEVDLDVLRLDGGLVGVDATHYAQSPEPTHFRVEAWDVIDAYLTVINEGHNVERMEVEAEHRESGSHIRDYRVEREWAEEYRSGEYSRDDLLDQVL